MLALIFITNNIVFFLKKNSFQKKYDNIEKPDNHSKKNDLNHVKEYFAQNLIWQ